ncbi:hypothetical protein BX661DRAFT_154366 [Kickxella alabastrina]|uniref:uncharacterized protein n=1 Tax=Kickxella alabastrina TaxID=61397 RepID=UPI00221F956A|nr:uncharacterized protein BX661DRAFT_154366 [Kickxella alabastrina]KAI7826418.1 hypothetical protein BX661DRAFT_154366 [Kickxella alabastrina]
MVALLFHYFFPPERYYPLIPYILQARYKPQNQACSRWFFIKTHPLLSTLGDPVAHNNIDGKYKQPAAAGPGPTPRGLPPTTYRRTLAHEHAKRAISTRHDYYDVALAATNASAYPQPAVPHTSNVQNNVHLANGPNNAEFGADVSSGFDDQGYSHYQNVNPNAPAGGQYPDASNKYQANPALMWTAARRVSTRAAWIATT